MEAELPIQELGITGGDLEPVTAQPAILQSKSPKNLVNDFI
jgi:hypothetical protein